MTYAKPRLAGECKGLTRFLVIHRRPRMALAVAKVLEQFKSDVGLALSPRAIREVCAALGHVYRQRVVDPVTTVHAFLLQVLHGNPRVATCRA